MSINPRSAKHNQESPAPAETAILFKIISRYSWDRMQAAHRAWTGSTLEHLYPGTGLFVLSGPGEGPRGGRA